MASTFIACPHSCNPSSVARYPVRVTRDLPPSMGAASGRQRVEPLPRDIGDRATMALDDEFGKKIVDRGTSAVRLVSLGDTARLTLVSP
jgi:hypothetical protein